VAQEVTEGWRKSHNDEFHDLYSGYRETWAWHAASLVERVLMAKSVGKRAFGRTGNNGRTVLKWVLK
jgi:hypothetical protein